MNLRRLEYKKHRKILKTYLFSYKKPIHMGNMESVTITNRIQAYSLPHVMYLSSLHRKIYKLCNEDFDIRLEA